MAATRTQLALAFAAVYAIWGSTYLAILWAIETIPPLLMAGSRFVVAAALLWLVGRPRGGGATRPTRKDWGWAAILGFLLFLMGNGFVTVAELALPSSVGALLVGFVPLWLVLFESVHLRRRPGPFVLAGLAAGLAGVAVLASAKEGWREGAGSLWLAIGVLVGCAGWALGSLLNRTPRIRLPLLRGVALQMLCGGLLLALAGLLRGEAAGLDWAGVSPRSLAAWGYLVVFGSLVAFSCYLFLLRNTTPALVGTYAFVNPVVAVALGALLANEPIGPATLLAAALIVLAVASISYGRARGPEAAAPAK